VNTQLSLDDILETALQSNATSVSLEYERIISELVERSGLETRVNGTIRVPYGGGMRVVRAAFDLRFG
jgi:hypothetical protein